MASLTTPESWTQFYSKHSKGLQNTVVCAVMRGNFTFPDAFCRIRLLVGLWCVDIHRDMWIFLHKSHPLITLRQTLNRGLVLDLTKNNDQTFAFGDVITLSTNNAIIDFTQKPSRLCVVGRNYLASQPLTIKVDKHRVDLQFYLVESTKPLRVNFITASADLGCHSFAPNENNIGVQWCFLPGDRSGPSVSEKRLPSFDETLYQHDLFCDFIQTQLRFATLSMYEHQRLSDSILSFILRLTHESKASADTFRRASKIQYLLADHAHASHLDTFLVPSITINAYESSLDALLNAASSYSAQYDRFIAEKTTIHARYDALYAMAEQHKAASIAQRQLLTQAEIAWKDATNAMDVARENAKVSPSVWFHGI
jgi:hypothetical protein